MKKTNTLTITSLVMVSIMLTNCKEDKKSSTAPTFDKVVTDKTAYKKKEAVTYTVSFKDKGENIGGIYRFAVTGQNGKVLAKGETNKYYPMKSFSENFLAPDTEGVFTLTVSAKTIEAYAGDKLFFEPAPMGSVSCTLNVGGAIAPTFDKVVTDKTAYGKKENVTYTVSFKDRGKNIGGTYRFAVTGQNGKILASGETNRYAPVGSFSEKFQSPDTAGVFTLTVSAKMIAAYAGDRAYLDPAPMGTISCTLNVTE